MYHKCSNFDAKDYDKIISTVFLELVKSFRRIKYYFITPAFKVYINISKGFSWSSYVLGIPASCIDIMYLLGQNKSKVIKSGSGYTIVNNTSPFNNKKLKKEMAIFV